jgi:DMSO/TMAO reductase YedYZ molybdopterin-dependent catalytic subunit
VGVAAAVTRPAAVLVDVVPSLVGTAVIGGALVLLLRPSVVAADERPARRIAADGRSARQVGVGGVGLEDPVGTGGAESDSVVVDRRAFIARAALVAAGTAVAGGGAVMLGRSATRAKAREALRLPAPADPAPPLPPVGPGFLTSNADFYRVDTALTVPQIDLDSWRLAITGLVNSPVELSYPDLLDRPLVERVITLNCVSNEVGGPYIGNARWLGVPLTPLLREAGLQGRADQLLARSVDGMTIGSPVAALFDGREPLLCVGMDGEPLPFEHGFPVRMLTPGLYGYVGACKWLQTLELTTFDTVDAYWVQRGWAAQGPVKTASRIDTPSSFAELTAGTATAIGGVAWAQTRGIRAVEVQVDDAPWQPATLLPVPSVDTWVQWHSAWTATPGRHEIRVRATDGTGEVQTADRADPFPDGATGWHTIVVDVT